MKAERSKEAATQESETMRGWIMKWKENRPHNTSSPLEDEGTSGETEAAVNYAGPAEVTLMKATTPNRSET